MSHKRNAVALPACNEALELRASGERGVWWERSDGLEVRLAAPERDRVVERSRLSFLGMLLACVASNRDPTRP